MKCGLTFRIFNKLGLINDKQKYGRISLSGFIIHFFSVVTKAYLFKRAYRSGIFETYKCKHIRAKLWRKMGCTVGENVFIGHSVVLDCGNTDLIEIGNNVSITDCCILLCHRKDISNYHKGDNSADLPFIHETIKLEDGVNLGKGCIIMPGVTIGEGSVIGAGSVVTKPIPAWCVAAGVPAKVIKELK